MPRRVRVCVRWWRPVRVLRRGGMCFRCRARGWFLCRLQGTRWSLIERGRLGLRAELIQAHDPYLEVEELLGGQLDLLGFLKRL